MRTHRSCTRQGGPCTTPSHITWLPCSTHLNTNISRQCTHLSASSGPSPLCGCGTPTSQSRPQNKQMWLTTTNQSVLGCDSRVPLSEYFRASADTKSMDPDVYHRRMRLRPAHCHACAVWHPRAPSYTATVEINLSIALAYCVYKAYAKSWWIFLVLSP